jgi:PPOX class probable F420-dependent enzyme
VATFATIGPDGLPQLSVVWFLYENGELAISLNASRQKTKNLRARPVCSLLILDLNVPERYLELRGVVEVSPDDGTFAGRVGKKYETDLSAYDQPGDTRVVVRIIPQRVHAVDMRG